MCCRTVVQPLDRDIARVILTIGQFTPDGDPTVATRWTRNVPEENCQVTVNIGGNDWEASISPSISAYTHHHGKRITGGLYFEISAKYAEKVGGKMTQKSNVAGCSDVGTHFTEHVMAHYPEMPMLWENACKGFREEILGESL